MSLFTKKSQPVTSAASVFFRYASASYQKRVFKKAIAESIKMQRETLGKAEEIQRQRED